MVGLLRPLVGALRVAATGVECSDEEEDVAAFSTGREDGVARPLDPRKPVGTGGEGSGGAGERARDEVVDTPDRREAELGVDRKPGRPFGVVVVAVVADRAVDGVEGPGRELTSTLALTRAVEELEVEVDGEEMAIWPVTCFDQRVMWTVETHLSPWLRRVGHALDRSPGGIMSLHLRAICTINVPEQRSVKRRTELRGLLQDDDSVSNSILDRYAPEYPICRFQPARGILPTASYARLRLPS